MAVSAGAFAVAMLCAFSVMRAQGRGQGQGMPQNPVLGSMRGLYEDVKRNIIEAAEKLPESAYNYKPHDETRTFGQQISHVADANYLFCSSLLSEKNPFPGAAPGAAGILESTKSKKVELVEAVKGSFALCDRAFAAAQDANLPEAVDFTVAGGTRKVTRAFLLTVLIYHTGRHYGSVATYMRLNGVVPPSTERQSAARSRDN